MMQDSQTTLIFVVVLLPVLHTGIAAYHLVRNAYKMADWVIGPHLAVIGQFAVFVVALFFTAGFVAAIRFVSILGTLETFLVTPVLFLLLCWIGQDRMLSYLATFRRRRHFLQQWKLRRIGLYTMLQVIFYYICVSLIALGAITYAEWTKHSGESPATQKLAMGFYPGNIAWRRERDSNPRYGVNRITP